VFSEEFKVDAFRLVTAEGYSIAAAAKSVGVGQQVTSPTMSGNSSTSLTRSSTPAAAGW